MKEFILENWKTALWILFASGFIFEITPIKFSPISMLLNWIGKKMNKDVEEKISKLGAKVDVVQTDLQNHKVESWRRDILNFADSISLGRNKSKEQFLYIISIHDVYMKYIKDYGVINGQVDAAFEYIQKKYNEHLENNNFYTGE